MAAKLTAAAARLQKAEKIVLLLLAMAAASGDLAFYPFKMCTLLATTVCWIEKRVKIRNYRRSVSVSKNSLQGNLQGQFDQLEGP